MTKTTNEKPGYVMMNGSKVLTLLRDIKTLWDEEGFGADEERSENLYHELCKCIEQLES